MAPLTVAEVQAHPEYPHVNWVLTPTKREFVSVAKGRGGPFNLVYELHGHGPTKLVFIHGLGGFMRIWQRQVKDFGHLQADKYTCLIFDNRGMGDSDKPLLFYSTSEMARDLIELLEHVGWTQDDRSLHVTGVSMGGMIAQELALMIPRRICSLNLVSTAPRIVRTVPFLQNVRNRINLVIPKSLDEQIAKVKRDCYTEEWLNAPDELEYTVQPFPTNGDRFAAVEAFKRTEVPAKYTRNGFLCQLVAAGYHHKSPEQVKQIGDLIGRNRIMVLHGEKDGMVPFIHGEMLLRELGGEESGVTKSFHADLSHTASAQMRKRFHSILEERIAKTTALNKETDA